MSVTSTIDIARPADQRLAGVVGRLDDARRRSGYLTVVAGLVGGLLTGLVAFCLFELANALLGSLTTAFQFAWVPLPWWLAEWRAAPVPEHMVVSIAAAVVGFGVVLAVAVARLPKIGALARAADRHFKMDECVSTALEVSAGPPKTGVVIEALMNRASAQTQTIDARNLVPFELSRWALGIPVLVGIAAVFVVMPPPPLLQQAFSSFGTVPGDVMAQEQREEVAANLRAIAAILKQDGDQRADAALQAIAQAMQNLGDQVAANQNMGAQALQDEIDRLVSLARDAYGRAGETAGGQRDLSRLVAGLNENAPNKPKGPVQRSVPPAPRPPPDRTGLPKDNPLAAVMTTREEEGGDDFADLIPPGTIVGDPGKPGGAGGDGAADAAAAGATDYDDFKDTYGEDGPDGGGGKPPGGVMVGAADGAGAGDMAGVGTRALFGPDGRLLKEKLDIAGQMLLQNPGTGGGRKIRFNLAPDAQLRDAAAGPNTAGAWVPMTEHEVIRAGLPAAAREIVSRYFQALRVEPGK